VRWPTRRLRPPSWKGLIGANQKLIAQAQGMLGGTQPGGDAPAFQQILAAYTLSTPDDGVLYNALYNAVVQRASTLKIGLERFDRV
jgi:hypothetical protein